MPEYTKIFGIERFLSRQIINLILSFLNDHLLCNAKYLLPIAFHAWQSFFNDTVRFRSEGVHVLCQFRFFRQNHIRRVIYQGVKLLHYSSKFRVTQSPIKRRYVHILVVLELTINIECAFNVINDFLDFVNN